MDQIKELIIGEREKILDETIRIRRAIHANPELEFEEKETAQTVCHELEKCGIEYTPNVAKTGVVGIIRGKNDNGKTLLIRADMDALAVKEETNLPFKSQKDGLMHACGHDVHTAILIGVAKVLNNMKDKFSGTVKLVFQPAEEGVGGALPMIEEGVLENPDVCGAIALHVWPELSVGKYTSKYDAIMASPDDFAVTIIGKGGHGGVPENAVNPLDIASEIAIKLKNIPTDLFGKDKRAVVSVCKIAGGTGNNIIPDTCEIMGTFRTLDDEARELTGKEIEKRINETVSEYGAKCSLTLNYLYPPTVNDRGMVDMLSDLCVDLQFEWLEKPSMTGEDFSFFTQRVPGVMCFLGTRNPDDATTHYPLHSPKFCIDERAIANGIDILSAFSLKFLAE